MRRAPMFGVVWLVLFTARCRSSPQGKNRLAHLFNYTKIAAHLLSEVESRGSNLSAYEMSALWDFMTDIRPSTKNAVVLASTLVKEFTLSTSRNASAIKELDLPRDVARQIRILRRNSQPNDQADVARLQSLITNMTEIYSTGKVCLNITRNNTCMSLDPDLGNLMSRSRNQDELVWAWRGWRDAVAPPVRGMFQQMVDLLNKGARQHGLGDYGHFERGEYEMGNDFTAVIKKLWTDVKPLYKELHAYVRFQLKKKYAGMSGSGPIPAHLLGNMWAQNWDGIYDMVQPYPDATPLDVTPSLIKQHYTPEKMFKLAQSFFVSIGLDPMPKSFWNKSMLRKPGNKSVVCHASAFDFLKDDVRIKMCTRLKQEDLITIHHEMGHCEYFLAYKDQPYAYRNGANPGFHEAIGDTIALSVVTPKHLNSVGLLYTLPKGDEASINFLMTQALSHVAPLPFTYLVDQWRWKVLAGEISPSNYNSAWWRMRTLYQGVKPPVARNESDFDPGAKFHIVSNSPYIGYFVSLILQFQFHRALCNLAKHTGPLHECSIYQSKEAGKKFKEMLAAGRSRPWPQTLFKLTGEREMSADPLLEYFAPLRKWLFNYRIKNNYTLGWKQAKKTTTTTGGVRKTLTSSTTGSPGSKGGHQGKGVSFTKTALPNDGLNLKKPDLKTALEAMQPNTAANSARNRIVEGELETKSIIQEAKPMFVPNKVKDQLELRSGKTWKKKPGEKTI